MSMITVSTSSIVHKLLFTEIVHKLLFTEIITKTLIISPSCQEIRDTIVFIIEVSFAFIQSFVHIDTFALSVQMLLDWVFSRSLLDTATNKILKIKNLNVYAIFKCLTTTRRTSSIKTRHFGHERSIHVIIVLM